MQTKIWEVGEQVWTDIGRAGRVTVETSVIPTTYRGDWDTVRMSSRRYHCLCISDCTVSGPPPLTKRRSVAHTGLPVWEQSSGPAGIEIPESLSSNLRHFSTAQQRSDRVSIFSPLYSLSTHTVLRSSKKDVTSSSVSGSILSPYRIASTSPAR